MSSEHGAAERPPRSYLLLGSTGSIGTSTLEIQAAHPRRFRPVGLAAHASVEKLEAQVRRFRPLFAVLVDEAAARSLRRRLSDLSDVRVLGGTAGLLEMITAAPCDLVVHGISGAAGLSASVAALQRGLSLALANKESLVVAGEILVSLARERRAALLPVDSEHSAIFQCLGGEPQRRFRRLILTGSGGPFVDRPLHTFDAIRPEEALRHPNWTMGARITVGSATMMNKALEVIEAHHLFDAAPEHIHVVIHRQSIVHSMVEYEDGSVLAQLGPPDMKVPIHVAMCWPERAETEYVGFDPRLFAKLTFEERCSERFPAVDLGYRAVREGGVLGAALNAADEIAVQRFLAGEISFTDIQRVNERVFERAPRIVAPDLEELVEADRWARAEANQCLPSSIS
ncbi:MAG: 1-deoxy-D-xylulose-5-phosphate reductoisomerase [Planctomycetes bacterium]|nr:1-deoxy-D-xylulose-5-phosphate reductoisomerase [Planctomycetota bacterium]